MATEKYWDYHLKLVKADGDIDERLEDVIDELCSLTPFSPYLYKLKHEFFWSHLKKRRMTKKEQHRRTQIINLLEAKTKTAKRNLLDFYSIVSDFHFADEDEEYRKKVMYGMEDWQRRLNVVTSLAIYTISLD
jgi:hypothetical protein